MSNRLGQLLEFPARHDSRTSDINRGRNEKFTYGAVREWLEQNGLGQRVDGFLERMSPEAVTKKEVAEAFCSLQSALTVAQDAQIAFLKAEEALGGAGEIEAGIAGALALHKNNLEDLNRETQQLAAELANVKSIFENLSQIQGQLKDAKEKLDAASEAAQGPKERLKAAQKTLEDAQSAVGQIPKRIETAKERLDELLKTAVKMILELVKYLGENADILSSEEFIQKAKRSDNPLTKEDILRAARFAALLLKKAQAANNDEAAIEELRHLVDGLSSIGDEWRDYELSFSKAHNPIGSLSRDFDEAQKVFNAVRPVTEGFLKREAEAEQIVQELEARIVSTINQLDGYRDALTAAGVDFAEMEKGLEGKLADTKKMATQKLEEALRKAGSLERQEQNTGDALHARHKEALSKVETHEAVFNGAKDKKNRADSAVSDSLDRLTILLDQEIAERKKAVSPEVLIQKAKDLLEEHLPAARGGGADRSGLIQSFIRGPIGNLARAFSSSSFREADTAGVKRILEQALGCQLKPGPVPYVNYPGTQLPTGLYAHLYGNLELGRNISSRQYPYEVAIHWLPPGHMFPPIRHIGKRADEMKSHSVYLILNGALMRIFKDGRRQEHRPNNAPVIIEKHGETFVCAPVECHTIVLHVGSSDRHVLTGTDLQEIVDPGHTGLFTKGL